MGSHGSILNRNKELMSNRSTAYNVTDRTITANNLALDDFPSGIFGNEEVERLEITGNRIAVIPGDIIKLQNLEEIDIHHNKLQSFPFILRKLPNLLSLNLSNNCITKITGSIDGFDKLQSINLLDNPLTSFPNLLGSIPELIHLSVSLNSNIIGDNDFDGFKKLATLVIDTKKTICIPKSLCELESITSITLATNYIPKEFSNLTTLRELNIKTNNRTRSFFIIFPYVKLSDLSSIDVFLPLNIQSMIFCKLGIIMENPALDLSEYNIPNNIKINIDSRYQISKPCKLLFKSRKQSFSIPQEKQISLLCNQNYNIQAVDYSGNIWTMDKKLFYFISNTYPQRFKSIPYKNSDTKHAIDENGNTIISKELKEFLQFDDAQDSVKKVYWFDYICCVLLDSGSIWIREGLQPVQIWKHVDIPPIKKLSFVFGTIIFLDREHFVWALGTGQKSNGIYNHLIKYKDKPTKLCELFPEIPPIKDISTAAGNILLLDFNGCVWANSIDKKFTKVEFPFNVLYIFEFLKCILFIDFDWNLWICGNTVHNEERELTCHGSIKIFFPSFASKKSARFI